MEANTRDFVESGRKAACEGSDQMKEKLSQGADAMKRYASKAKDTATEYAKQAKDVTQTHIKENPFWAMLIAVGVGLTLGMLLAPSSREE